MSQLFQLEYFFLRYVPRVTSGDFATIGLIMVGRQSTDFAMARFLKKWEPVLFIDPQADIDTLRSLATDMTEQIRNSQHRESFLRQIRDSFSNIIQLSEVTECVCDNPVMEFEALWTAHFNLGSSPLRRHDSS